MRIDELIDATDRPVFSFEFFPPKTDEGEQKLRDALMTLVELEPDFVSVTYGAGGSSQHRTLNVTRWIKEELGIEAMAHLSCVGAGVDQLRRTLDDLTDAGIENVLALRGDPPKGAVSWEPHPDGLRHSSELIELIDREYPLAIGAACFPEVHPEAVDAFSDLQYLKTKVDAGATFLVTQLFFDNDAYFRFVDSARAAGIEVPILPGIMPITNTDQIKTITNMCGATVPESLLEQLELRAGNPEAVTELGVSYATLQCADLLSRGAPGIHFYTLNRSPATRAILAALKLQTPWVRVSRQTRSARLRSSTV
jgi:methylenetetrahydrofolate reductase (NADPH)